MTIAFVYKWTQLSTGMWYIGSRTAKNCHPDDGYICSSKIVRPLIVSNPDDWTRTILYIDEPEKIREKESSMLQELNAKQDQLSYNRHNNDSKFFPLYEYSDETKRKISEAHKGRVISEEWRRNISEGSKGKIVSEETRRKMSNRIVSEETRRKISELRKGTTRSEETKRKISEAQKNRPPFSEETLEKLRGRIVSEEHRRKISEANKGKKKPPISEEHRRKISEANKGRVSPKKGIPLSEETKRKISETKRNKNKV